MFRTEMEFAYFRWVRAPGEHRSVFDNFTDLEANVRRTGANATVAWANPKEVPEEVGSEGGAGTIPALSFEGARQLDAVLRERQVHATVVLGDHNNPWFPFFPEECQARWPDAFMRGADGALVELRDPTRREGRGIPMPGIDAPPVLRYSSRCIREGVPFLRDNPHVAAWVIGSEEGYTDFLIGPMGDFRPDAWTHFLEWLAHEGRDLRPTPRAVADRKDEDLWNAWVRFREQAMADRAAFHMQDYLSVDASRPVFYPTHGSPFWGDSRWKLAQPAGLMAPACDGLEMGHIPVDDDDERSNPLVFAHFSSFGMPVMVPRLGNRTVDFTARGLGRSFTPEMLRRLVYESLGCGAWHIGPIHWSSVLHDGEWFIRDTPAEPACKTVFQEIADARPVLLGMGRLQPQVGLYASDATWLDRWNPAWTGFFQDALDHGWNLSILSDEPLIPGLADRTRALVCLDDARIARGAARGLSAYLDEGGRLVVYGRFLEQDERGLAYAAEEREAMLSHPGVAVVRPTGPARTRRLVTESLSHTEGSHRVVTDYEAIPFDAVAETLSSHVPDGIARPLRLVDEMPLPSDVDVFPLTDRASLLAVLVNNGPRHATMRLAPDPRLESPGGWTFQDAVRGTPLGEGDSVRVHLPRHGSMLVWAVPCSVAGLGEDAVDRARSAIQGFRDAGCDAGPFGALEEALAADAEEGLRALKRRAAARSALDSLAVRIRARRDDDGSIALSVDVLDAGLLPVADARVTARLTPDRFRRHALTHASDGTYEARLSGRDLPCFYDPFERRYKALSGPVRVVVQAEDAAGRAGGGMALLPPRA